ncbi:MAG: TIGR00269 family protein [Candidatus Thermoplasmatota archaeon]|jgi:uncharacterized protein (TIGR00269 family)|nr:TIGR00269 family protein [Candidatus Thermoplasmatota archaeon]MCL5962919.1 TIGR00269 family protein [Candidatus Thermoplasmatota archaeon]
MDKPACSLCKRDSIIYIRYSGSNYCEMHFIDFIKKRVRENLRNQVLFKKGDRIAVAVSGGKDSMGMLKLLKEVVPPIPDLKLIAITIDEGIAGYRDITVPKVKKFAEMLNIEHRVISFSDIYGITMDDTVIKKKDYTPCTYCGVWRRKAMNIISREFDADYLAVGMNLDDISQSILMNFTKADIARLSRLGPHNIRQENLIPRLLPLVTIPEKEMYMYAYITGIEFHKSSCPYYSTAMRNIYREVVNKLEERMPGTRHSILQAHRTILPMLQERYPMESINTCKICGEPSVKEICKSCELYIELEQSSSVGSDDLPGKSNAKVD